MAPETIAPYRILEPLREGGVSSVYKAVGPAGTPVAVKVFSTRVLASPAAGDPPGAVDRHQARRPGLPPRRGEVLLDAGPREPRGGRSPADRRPDRGPRRPLPSRGPRRRPALPPQHPAGPRDRAGRRPPLPRHRALRRRLARAPAQGAPPPRAAVDRGAARRLPRPRLRARPRLSARPPVAAPRAGLVRPRRGQDRRLRAERDRRRLRARLHLAHRRLRPVLDGLSRARAGRAPPSR